MKGDKEPTLRDLREQLERVESLAAISAKPVIGLDEAVVFTGLSKQHLYFLTSNRRIPHYKKGRKIYFKKTELETWLLEEKIVTIDAIAREASTYVATH